MSDFEKIYNDAIEFYKQEEFADSARLLNQIIDAKPFFAPAYNLLADISYQNGFKEEALKLYTECLEIVPNDVMGYVGASKVLCDFERYNEALNLCEQVKEENDNLNLNKARAFWGLKNHKKAKTIFKKIIKNNKSILAKAYLANIFLEESEYNKAVDLCNDILERDNKFFLAYVIKAKVFFKIEKYELSLDFYRQALNIEPYNIDALIDTARVLMILGKKNECFDDLKLAIENTNNDGGVIAKISWLLYEEGYVVEAFDVLENAFKKSPNDSKLNIAIGQLLLEEGSTDFLAICNHLRQAVSNQDLTERDVVLIHNQILTMLRNDKDGNVKELVSFWHNINPYDSLVIHLNHIINAEKIEACEIGYLKRIYDFRAENNNYEKVLDVTNTYNAMFDLLSKSVFADRNNCSVLDAGCGVGSLAEMLRPIASNGSFCGIDMSSKMIEISRKLELYDNLYEIEISKFLEDTYDYFDLIVVDGILQTKGDIITTLKDFTKSLVLGGHLLFTVNINNAKDDFRLSNDGLFCHSVPYIKKIISDFDVELVMDKSFSYKNLYNQFISSRCFLVSKTFL